MIGSCYTLNIYIYIQWKLNDRVLLHIEYIYIYIYIYIHWKLNDRVLLHIEYIYTVEIK